MERHIQNTISSREGWWEFSDSIHAMSSCGATGFATSSSPCGVGPASMPNFEYGPASEQLVDARMIPFSPSFSPLELHAPLDPGDAYFAAGDPSTYWMGNIEYTHDALLASPPGEWSDIPSCSPDLWTSLMLPPICDEPSPKPSYRFPSSSTLPYPRIAPRLRPRAPSPASDASSAASILTSTLPPPSSIPQNAAPTAAQRAHPLWRRNPATREPLCNACGLYLQQRHTLRPLALIEFDASSSSPSPSSPEFDDADPDAPECSHCHTRHTSVWRRHKTTGAKLCNACGVYVRLRGKDRPLTLKRERIRPRGRHPK
ncbi:GATA zinc finger domain-containing protein [Mycena sanguinolenta]|uniref:GATA zinc finger domain-containing protein n=1 Tax=Mycena sanguinolenta TaxID=230812 RepID=A0A8H6XQ77_9AGAR|nr:GATA zinc finger domain-containing protein [Mycena sanguinolenta]